MVQTTSLMAAQCLPSDRVFSGVLPALIHLFLPLEAVDTASITGGTFGLSNEGRIFTACHVVLAHSERWHGNLVLRSLIGHPFRAANVSRRPRLLRRRGTRDEFACRDDEYLGTFGAVA